MGVLTGQPLLKILILVMIVGASLGLRIDPKVTAFLSRGKKMGVASISSTENMNIVIEVEGERRSGSSARNGVGLSSYSVKERKAGAKAMKDDMVQWAQHSQAGILAKLKNKGEAATGILRNEGIKMAVTPSWITNRVIVRGATALVIDSLCHDKNMNISVIREEIRFKINNGGGASTQSSSKWHVDKIGAPKFWREKGTKGEGIIIGHIDTGARGTHEALRDNWVDGSGGWLDPTSYRHMTPHDSHDHGTHTLALAVGSKGVGVAPGAKWMSCLGCPAGECTERDLIACAEFMVCPGRKNGNCSGIPHIVTNSWGTTDDNVRFYDRVIRIWRQVGIIPLFAAGNSKNKKCSTLNSPCDDPDVICVGGTTEEDELAAFSSIGPSHRNPKDIKPDITAPGKSVSSALPGHDSQYGKKSGTSMATPIVAGGIALLLSDWKKRKIEYSFDKVKDWITKNAKKSDLTLEDGGNVECNGKSYKDLPNDFFGHGGFRVANGASKLSTYSFVSKSTHFVTTFLFLKLL